MSTYPALFTYSGQDIAALREHDGQEAIVLSRITDPAVIDEAEVGPMFVVRFADGYESDVWRDELLCLHDGEEDASDCIVGSADRPAT